MEVDQLTHFSRHFTPIQGHQSKPSHFYRTLMATLISQATNLGVVSMSASVKGTTIDMLRHVLHYFIREETLTAASAEIVNRHHELPLSVVHGSGNLSSSDAQRFGNGIFTPLLTKTADLDIIEEQWEEMIRVAISLKKRTAPAHVIVQRLTNSFPADRLSKAFTNFGRILKTQYILRYLTDPNLRQTVQLQLNKGEYRHKLPRRIFFADQGEFTTGDYEEIMNKASCLSLVSNAILYWNTIKINDIIEELRGQGEVIEDETLSHISLLPFKHVVPNGTYFIDDL